MGGFSLSSVRSLPRSNWGACRLPKGDLCKSYTHSLARSNSMLRSLPTRIVIGRIIARSAKSVAL